MTLPDANLYIDGVVRPASDGRYYENISPWSGEAIGRAAEATGQDVDAAIGAARNAFDHTDWSINHGKRFDLLVKWQKALADRRAQLVEIAKQEAGAAPGAAAITHVGGALDAFTGLLALFPHIAWEEDRGESEAFGVRSHRIVTREAIGVVGAITPWNVPFYVNVGRAVSAMLTGCTVVLKAAPDTPAAAAIMGEAAVEAGFPAGVFNVITSSDPAMAGEMLTGDSRVDTIGFTGSTATGKRIMARAAATLKRVHLELGGKSARIILDDAPEFATEVMQSINVFHAGQICASLSRLLVPRSRYQEAVAALEMAYGYFDQGWGDAVDPTHVMGPLASRAQFDRVMHYIEIGRQEGARLLVGGKARPDKGGGFFVEPTCFVDVTGDMRIAREEIFGPVLVVIPYEDDEDAIRIANDSDYGLSGGVVSGDSARAMRVARRIRTGSISVNGGIAMAPDLPFGGYKNSGIGREWGVEGLYEFMETKVIGMAVR
ncbi:MAG TPA: aldehyde dehydrogenase family protein [Novosphingobium sp.]